MMKLVISPWSKRTQPILVVSSTDPTGLRTCRRCHILRELEAVELEGDVCRIQDIRETLTIHNGLAVKGQEVDRLAGTIFVIPDFDTAA